MLLSIVINVNITLMVFNLLPIPPLDGSRLWSSFLPGRWAYTLEQYSRYITMGLLVLSFSGALDMPLFYLRSGVTRLLVWMFGWIFV
jgi:Zn-dependent protease